MKRLCSFVWLGLMLVGCGRPAVQPESTAVPVYTYEVVAIYPHDAHAFTQGLQYHEGHLYESTGLYGRSSLRKVELDTGRVLQRVNLPDTFFGEGIALDDHFIYMLTWRGGVGFVFDRDSFRRVGQFAYAGEGWGLAYNGEHLILSDGTADLRFLDTARFEEVRRVTVRDGDRPVKFLNELAWVDGQVWANVFQQERVVRIDPTTGDVVGWIDFAGLLTPELQAGRPVDVLNGIAYDPDTHRIWVTGKWWPVLFEVAIRPL